MPADRPGTKRTPWAACADEERLHTGDTEDDAIDAAMVDLADAIERGDCNRQPGETIRVRVYRDVLWCTGAADDITGDCACGAGHDDHEQIAMKWAETKWTTATVSAELEVGDAR